MPASTEGSRTSDFLRSDPNLRKNLLVTSRNTLVEVCVHEVLSLSTCA